MNILDYTLAGGAAVIAGAVNAIAGGGTLLTFPVLTALGLPAVVANVTNTVALCPCYLSATLAQRETFKTQKKRLLIFFPVSLIGGVLGGLLLLHTEESTFRKLIPYLILLASCLLAFQNPIKKWVAKHRKPSKKGVYRTVIPIVLATIYGGYFGAGVSVIILAVLGITFEDSLTELNVLKTCISLGCNVAAAVFFLFSGQVQWAVAGVMAIGALVGGSIGGHFASRIKPATLRWVVVSVGFTIAIIYFVR